MIDIATSPYKGLKDGNQILLSVKIAKIGTHFLEYISTRSGAPELAFRDALLTGLARDGGLYVPKTWPTLSKRQLQNLSGMPYPNIAKVVLAPFVEGEIGEADFHVMIDEAYASFHHRAVAPLVQFDDNHWLLELFHGPTLAFKDVAMQLLARMMDHVLAERGQRATIIGATSGDTGGAAIEAFRGRDNIDIFILFPDGKVSAVQRRQMTTVDDANVHTIAIKGDFDDCQALVKAMFNDLKFRDRLNLSGVNSINWGRIMAQIVYYVSAATSIGAPHRHVSFTVPTGNFGDIFAGYVAKKMGLPVSDLVIATNCNDILTRAIDTGRYETQTTTATISPSMDIQVSSNFERLLFEVCGRDGTQIQGVMQRLKQSGAFEISPESLSRIRKEFSAGRCSEEETKAELARAFNECGYLADPHTCVGLHVAETKRKKDTPMITLATAHPAKFPDAVETATGIRPTLPSRVGQILELPEHFRVLDNDVSVVEEYVESNSRIMISA